MATVLPDAVSPVDTTSTAEIINPTGDPSLTEAAIERLAYVGVGVVLVKEVTGVAVPAQTEVVLASTAQVGDLKTFTDGLGGAVSAPAGRPGSLTGRVVGIDAVVVLGASFKALVARQTPVPTTTLAGASA